MLIATYMFFCVVNNGTVSVIKLIVGFTPAICFTAMGYFMRLVFKETSKKILQHPLFKEDETRMPTTESLLWSTQIMSKAQKQQIHRQVKEDFGISLLTESEERKNGREARLTIVDAIGKIRNTTRGNTILLKANYEYGFWRNLIGGFAWALLFVIILFVSNAYITHISCWWFIGAIVLIISFAAFDYLVCFGSSARYYAKQLFAAYLP
jgi:hypothetical protein